MIGLLLWPSLAKSHVTTMIKDDSKRLKSCMKTFLSFSVKTLGENHPDILHSIGALSSVYMSQTRWRDAEELELHALTLSKEIHGIEHPETLTCMQNLAVILKNPER